MSTQLSFTPLQRLLTLSLALSLPSLTPSLSYATDCQSDTDCAEGQRCERGVSVGGTCYSDESGETICEELEEVESAGFCVDQPIECETDADCPSHLRCRQGGEVSVGGSSGGSEGAPPPIDSGAPEPAPEPETEPETDPAPPEDLPPNELEGLGSFCVFIPQPCEDDSACGEGFGCELESYTSGCAIAAPDCPEGEACDPLPPEELECEEETWTEGYCMPQELECDSDSACPADWRCEELVSYTCEGAERPVSPEDEFMEIDEPSCTEEVRSLCVPVGLSSYGGVYSEDVAAQSGAAQSGAADRESGANGEALEGDEAGGVSAATSSDAVEDDGGCEAVRPRSLPVLLLALFALLGITRRASRHAAH